MLLGRSHYDTIFVIFELYPSIKMAIPPSKVDQFEKFQCLELSTAQGLSPGVLRSHVAHVTCPQTCLEVCQLYM